MKSISVQYQELKEGRITQHQFLRNARMLFPNYVTNHNSFEDSVKILKNRGLLNEGDAVKGTPDKAPSYDYPTQPAKYKKVVQKPEVDEQDGIYPATTLTDIPKEEVSKPIKSKNRPDGLEPAKDKDKKNEMKKIRIVKESKKSLNELGPDARQMAGNPEEERASRITMIRRRRDNDKDAEIEAMIARAKREKEEEEGLEDGFGIYDLEEDNTSPVVNTSDEKNLLAKLEQNPMLLAALKLIGSFPELDGAFHVLLNKTGLDNAAKTQIKAALAKSLDQDKDSNFTSDAVKKPKPASTNPIDQARQGLRSAGVNPNDSKNKLREVIKKLVNEALNEYEKGDENDKAPSIKEATKDIIDIMVKKLKNEESFKKSELDDVFSKYESTAGKRYSNSVFQDVISGLKTKGYKIKYK